MGSQTWFEIGYLSHGDPSRGTLRLLSVPRKRLLLFPVSARELAIPRVTNEVDSFWSFSLPTVPLVSSVLSSHTSAIKQ